MGLIAAILGERIHTPRHEVGHSPVSQDGLFERLIRQARTLRLEPSAAVGVPGPPPVPHGNAAPSPLPDLDLVETGMRQISGGRRRSF